MAGVRVLAATSLCHAFDTDRHHGRRGRRHRLQSPWRIRVTPLEERAAAEAIER
jgi:hypothetical protein